MTIGINGFEAVVSRFGYDPKTGLPNRVGSGQYCFELLLNFNEIDKKNNYIIYIPDNPASDMPQESENWNYKIVKPRKLWTMFGLSFELILGNSKPDIFFTPTHYLPLFTSIPSAISILDLSYLHFPQLFKGKDFIQLKYWGRYSIKKAKRIFTISQASKDDIINLYKIPSEKIIVTYPGIKSQISNLKSQNMEDLKKKYGINNPYILFVGTIQPRKNIVRLIEAFSKLKTDVELVIVGRKGWMWEEILVAPEKFDVEKRVKFLHEIPDDELPNFYKNAICFVLPSLYEGFGLPILEAMKYGCPVLTSNISSLPEAGGQAAIYFNPENVEEITKNLKKIIEDLDLRRELATKGYEQVKKFSWEKTARETLKALESI
ncbi:MAG: glycosyltransferase family 4 protein [Candidatus Levybacteria bacterium]|nr:glycosyltransferase family 4 protein [Candidatus Levybacteria bacterium]